MRAYGVRNGLGGILAVILGIAAPFLAAAPARASEESCVAHAIEAEQELNIPSGLLVSIALVESGQDGVPHPFAMSVQGRAVYARNVGDAARHLRDRNGRLRSNVFVGCMQLGVAYHRSGFEPVDRIVEPRENVRYAANMLLRLHGEFGSWRSAVAHYNGGSTRQGRDYVCKVWQHMNELEPESARVLSSSQCGERGTPAISPNTRRTFRDKQVASIN